MTTTANDVAGAWARRYRDLGYNPLPSSARDKRPALRAYAGYRDGTPIPDAWLDRWWTPNVQIPCGVAWRLAVVDLDGIPALLRWRDLAREHADGPGPTPPFGVATWTVRTGGGGLHLYFRLPEALRACPTRKLWAIRDGAGGWAARCQVELLGDRALAVAPPSTHVRTGVPYGFLPGLGPDDLPGPAPIPAWVLGLEPVDRRPSTFVAPAPAPRRAGRRGRYRAWRDVLDALGPDEKLDLARRWGLRLAAAGPNAAGWVRCHAVGREDRNPSAAFCPASGYYSEPNVRRMNLYDLAVALGAYGSWLDCLNDLAERSRTP